MKTSKWPVSVEELPRFTNSFTDPEAAGLLMWAVWAADGLFYLLQLDDQAFGASAQRPSGTRQEAMDMAHVRWAAANAITVLDLCAASLGRLYCPLKRHGQEYSVEDFRGKEEGRFFFDRLPSAAQDWVKRTVGDADFRIVKRARDPLIHRRLRRVVYATVGGPPAAHQGRTGFYVGPRGAEVGSRALIEKAARLVERRVVAILTLLRDGTLP